MRKTEYRVANTLINNFFVMQTEKLRQDMPNFFSLHYYVCRIVRNKIIKIKITKNNENKIEK